MTAPVRLPSLDRDGKLPFVKLQERHAAYLRLVKNGEAAPAPSSPHALLYLGFWLLVGGLTALVTWALVAAVGRP